MKEARLKAFSSFLSHLAAKLFIPGAPFLPGKSEPLWWRGVGSLWAAGVLLAGTGAGRGGGRSWCWGCVGRFQPHHHLLVPRSPVAHPGGLLQVAGRQLCSWSQHRLPCQDPGPAQRWTELSRDSSAPIPAEEHPSRQRTQPFLMPPGQAAGSRARHQQRGCHEGDRTQ